MGAPDGTVRLYIGAENWPLPIPLVNYNDAWYFDTGAGKDINNSMGCGKWFSCISAYRRYERRRFAPMLPPVF